MIERRKERFVRAWCTGVTERGEGEEREGGGEDHIITLQDNPNTCGLLIKTFTRTGNTGEGRKTTI